MDREQTRNKIKELIEEIMELDIETIDNDKNLAEVDEWDSFNNLMLISRVEDEFKVKFSVKDIEGVDTINKIIDITQSKITD